MREAVLHIRIGRWGTVSVSKQPETTMADDKTKVGGQDRKLINTSEDYEVRDWAKKFGVTPEQLKQAVKDVGNRAEDVEAHLKKGG